MEVTRINPPVQPAGAAAGGGRGTEAAPSAQARAREDRLTLSQKAAAMLEEQARRQAELKAERKRAEELRESGKQQAEAMAKALKIKLLCWKIASRIMAGDKVPPEDERFLMENDIKTYQLAMSARIIKEDPEEYDSVLGDEEAESGGTKAGASVEAAPAEGGGEAAAAE